MRELILACLGIVVQLAVFFCIGGLFTKVLKVQKSSSLALIFGYLAYFAVFEVLAVPATLMWVSLTGLTVLWGLLLLLILILSVVFLRKQWKSQLSLLSQTVKKMSVWQWLAVLAVLMQMGIVVFYQDVTVDAAYYVGTVSASVYSDTLGRYNPFNPQRLMQTFQARYVFSAYPMNNAVWCRILGIHPLVQCKIVMSVINVLLSNLIVYQTGKKLFKGKKDPAGFMVCLVCLMQLFSYTIYTAGTFFFTRSYEGKALLANISIPMVLFCACWLWEREGKKNRNVWILLFLTAVSALTFSGSSIIFPAVISAGILPMILLRRKWKDLLPYAICMIPGFLYAVLYLAVKLGWITLLAS